MALGDINWTGGGPVGYCQNIVRSLPSGGTVYITSATQLTTLINAMRTPNTRIIINAGLTFVFPAGTIQMGNNVWIICLSGEVIFDCRATNGGDQFSIRRICVFGNIRFLKALGNTSLSNNPAALFGFDNNDSDMLYLIGCTIVDPVNVGEYPNDGPEGINAWDNTGNGTGPQRFVAQYCRWDVNGGVTKSVILGGYQEQSRMEATLYCNSFSPRWRSPMLGANAKVDVVNNVYPNVTHNEAIIARTGGRVNVRGNMFLFSGGVAVGNHGGGNIYAPLSGAGLDNNYRPNGNSWTTTSAAPVVTPPYILTPRAADAALAAEIDGDAGTGFIVFTIEGESEPPPPPPGGDTVTVEVISDADDGYDDGPGTGTVAILERVFMWANRYGEVLFRNLGIPADANITSALFKPWVDDAAAIGAGITVYGEDDPTPAALVDGTTNEMRNRAKTAASVLWSSASLATQASINVSSIIQELVDNYGAIDDVGFILVASASTQVTFFGLTHPQDKPPILEVTWESAAGVVTTYTTVAQFRHLIRGLGR